MIVSDADVATAVLAALNSGGASGTAHADELDTIKKAKPLPNSYTEVTVSRRFGGESRNDAYLGTDAFRVTARQCSKVDIFNARELRRRTRVNLEYAYIAAGGLTSTPVLFETAEDIGQDEQGYWSGLETYTFTF